MRMREGTGRQPEGRSHCPGWSRNRLWRRRGQVVPPASGTAVAAAALQFIEQMWLQAHYIKSFKSVIS